MPNMNRGSNIGQNAHFGTRLDNKWRSLRGDINILKRRLKENQKKKNKGKFILVTTLISVLFISGIIISF